jgi:hypothetical protein
MKLLLIGIGALLATFLMLLAPVAGRFEECGWRCKQTLTAYEGYGDPLLEYHDKIFVKLLRESCEAETRLCEYARSRE